MPIPFQALDELDALGEAAFLKIDYSPAGPSYNGALLLVNARGEPVEFTYSRLETPFAAIWRQDDVKRFAVRTLAVSLLSLCPRVPRVLFCRADEVDRDLFELEVQLSIPIGRVGQAVGSSTDVTTAGPVSETAIPGVVTAAIDDGTTTGSPADLFWLSGRPPADSDAARLLYELISRGLGTEPFDRASRGLREVYGASTQCEER